MHNIKIITVLVLDSTDLEFQQSYPGHYMEPRGHFNALATSHSLSSAQTLWCRKQGGKLRLLHLVTEKFSIPRAGNRIPYPFTLLSYLDP
jgi:hypothetical protein